MSKVRHRKLNHLYKIIQSAIGASRLQVIPHTDYKYDMGVVK